MARNDKLFAQFTMMNYLQSSNRDRTLQDVLDHLHQNTLWGRGQFRQSGPGDSGRRNVQNWLTDISRSDEFTQQIEVRADPENRRQNRYRSLLPAIGERIMPPEEACTLLLAEKHIDAALPADFYDESLQKLFIEARETLKKYERRPKKDRWRAADYLKRIAIAQRGQALADHVIPYDVLGAISRAMLEGRCVDMRYSGKKRTIHPYGIVIKSPKIYLLGIDDHTMRKRNPATLRPAQFLCARIEQATTSDTPNKVPNDFSCDAFIEKEGMDVAVYDNGKPWDRAFSLKLRVFAGASDNLLQDLREFPLSRKQRIVPEEGSDNHILTAPGMRASHQLTEWVVGRLDRVEVIAPTRFRDHIASRLSAAAGIYSVK